VVAAERREEIVTANTDRVSVESMSTQKKFIGTKGVAEICDITQATVRSYRRFGMLPEPDVWIDDRPGWTSRTIRGWQARRPALNQRPFSKADREEDPAEVS
jgi:hypothetical protein